MLPRLGKRPANPHLNSTVFGEHINLYYNNMEKAGKGYFQISDGFFCHDSPGI